MPPRFAYWTILIDNKPTAFRAAKREELQPTFAQLKRTNSDVTVKWFARGRLWDNPEQAEWAGRNTDRPAEKRGRDWRPGGAHRAPRAQFDRRPAERPGKPPRPNRDRTAAPRDPERRPAPPGGPPPQAPGGGKRPWSHKPPRGPWHDDRKPQHNRDQRAEFDRRPAERPGEPPRPKRHRTAG